MKLFLPFIFLLSGACIETSSNKSSPAPAASDSYSPAAPISYQADIYAKEAIAFEYDGISLFDGETSPQPIFVLENSPSWLSVNGLTGQLSGTPDQNGLHENIVLKAKDQYGKGISATFSLAVNGDPLRKHAWHFENTSQRTFSYRGGQSTVSVNALPVYARGITGQGVTVGVSDSGVEINHDDLYQNSLPDLHKDYTKSAPYYGIPTASHFHGTAVASLIAAKGWNNEGSMGVAPNAGYAGFQFLDSIQSSSILINQASGTFDIFNYSYGDYLNYDTTSDQSYIDHLKYMATNGRDGKGSFFVKAAGNEFYSHGGYVNCTSHNANAPYENESPYIIVAGAVNADGEKSSYSNAGSNIWVSAPGGENGKGLGPAILAADLPTCFKGESKASSDPANEFEYGHELNPLCNYTSRMNGTSSAAPILSGVIALILEQNPSLSMREVKHILAVTAQKIDLGSNAWPKLKHPAAEITSCSSSYHALMDEQGYEYEQGWTENDAGITFHNYYGFGLADADAAVFMAQSGYKSMPELVEINPNWSISNYENTTDVSIPDFDAGGAQSQIAVAVEGNVGADFVVESVQVQVQVEHPYSGEIGIELYSPSPNDPSTPTKSILLNVNNSFLEPKSCDGGDCSYDSNLNITLTSHAFYGENAVGTWTLKVVDGMRNDTGKLLGWKLNILGHNP